MKHLKKSSIPLSPYETILEEMVDDLQKEIDSCRRLMWLSILIAGGVAFGGGYGYAQWKNTQQAQQKPSLVVPASKESRAVTERNNVARRRE
ncbi:MAG: hypothetical protein ACI4QM_04855 [Alphaproteobacteria bacterium]